MIIYIQPIFAPNEYLLERNIQSIQSFKKLCEANNYYPQMIFGGWAYNDDFWNRLILYININFKQAKIVRFDKNYGKAYTVNELYKIVSDLNFKYILTSDSDICYNETSNFFNRLIYMSEASFGFTAKRFGVCALNQLDECAHTVKKEEIKLYHYIDLGLSEEFGVPSKADGIAGGSLFVSREAWDKVKGYRVMGVYAGDDAYLIHDIFKTNLLVYISYSLDIIHPREKDSNYRKLKFEVIGDGSSNGINKDKETLEKIIIKYDNFWKNENSN